MTGLPDAKEGMYKGGEDSRLSGSRSQEAVGEEGKKEHSEGKDAQRGLSLLIPRFRGGGEMEQVWPTA